MRKLKILSLNIEGISNNSDLKRQMQSKIFVDEIENNYQPDIILLQEYTNFYFLNNLKDYQHTNNVSQVLLAGNDNVNCNIVVYKKDLNVTKKYHDCIEIDNTFRIISYRGMPFKEGERDRRDEIKRIIAIHKRDMMSVNFAGDTNARAKDFHPRYELKLAEYFSDCWELEGSSYDNKFTVDAYNNQYFPDGFKYTARYDRSYISKDLKCTSFEVVFKKKYKELIEMFDGSGCISDHYGILYTLELPGIQPQENQQDIIDLLSDDDTATPLILQTLTNGTPIAVRLLGIFRI